MKNLLRGWGFPVGLLVLWVIAAAYTAYALSGMESAVRSANLTAIAAMQSQDTASPSRPS